MTIIMHTHHCTEIYMSTFVFVLYIIYKQRKTLHSAVLYNNALKRARAPISFYKFIRH